MEWMSEIVCMCVCVNNDADEVGSKRKASPCPPPFRVNQSMVVCFYDSLFFFFFFFGIVLVR